MSSAYYQLETARPRGGGALLLGLVFVVVVSLGSFASAYLFQGFETEFVVLTTVALGAIVAVGADRAVWSQKNGHLALIFAIVFVGYFVKLFVYALGARSNRELVGLEFNPFEIAESADVLKCFVICTVGMLATAVAILFVADRRVEDGLRGMWEVSRSRSLVPARIYILILLAVLTSVVTLAAQVRFGLGVSSLENSTALPFRLAGIIQHVRTEAIPCVVLFCVWAADRSCSAATARLAGVVFMLHVTSCAIWSTSRGPVILGLVSLAWLWWVTGTLSRERKATLLVILPVVFILSTVLGGSRQLRSGTYAVNAAGGLRASTSDLFKSGGVVTAVYRSVTSVVMRINGVDMLLPIATHNPPASVARAVGILTDSADVNTQIATDVLGISDLRGVAFSSSLLGFFYFVSGSVVFVFIGTLLYVVFWHFVIRAMQRSHLVIAPVVVSLLIGLILTFTSEGSLQQLPLACALVIGAGFSLEPVARTMP